MAFRNIFSSFLLMMEFCVWKISILQVKVTMTERKMSAVEQEHNGDCWNAID